MMTVQDLPIEVLSESFRTWLSQTPMLISRIFVSFANESVLELEKAAQHPVFSQSIRSLTFNVSFYHKTIAQQFDVFVKACGASIIAYTEFEGYTFENAPGFGDLFSQTIHLQETVRPSWDPSMADEIHEPYLKAQLKYAALYNHQEALVGDKSCVGRLAAVFDRFTGLDTILVDDSCRGPRLPRKRRGIEEKGFILNDEGLANFSLHTTRGENSHVGTPANSQIVQSLLDIFEALASSETRPKVLEMQVLLPLDLRFLGRSEARLAAARVALSRTENVTVILDHRTGWFPADDIDDSPPDLDVLCSLLRMLISSPCLSKLALWFTRHDRKRGLFHAASMSLLDFLPHLTLPTNTKRIWLRNIPLRMDDLRDLVTESGEDLQLLDMNRDYYLTGDWVNVPDMLRSLEKSNSDEYVG
ncbi:hypothetical protein K491DRAFT_717460 [Lophiostoma macrostomum CBS 122681]|uniref:Uncharacterized protein n=1 Tax=Lophiostoma macrostomum CBS 122681 TaxID=1314788 RepID=A0A6A6T4F0_9PLEO|nr:hypothetical protein K491DRAFT_717460 [Lophiostoma macrostomum CBS 122681]